MRAAIYLRVSSDAQAGDDHASLAVQEAACRQYAARHGWDVVACETDVQSGREQQRTAYQRILALARSGGVDVALVWKFDRWGRDAIESLSCTRELTRLGVELHSTLEDLSNWLMMALTAVLAEHEVRTLAARVGPAKRHKAAEGYWLGHAPFGTVNDHGVLRPDVNFDLVRMTFQLAADGVALREINRRLNGAMAPRTIDLSTVRTMLRNPAYAGRVVWDTVDAPARWKPLIDLELFERAGQRITRRYRERAPLSVSYPFWIVGLAFCGRCGARMHPKISVKSWGTKYAYLICGRRNVRAVSRGCHGTHYLIEDIQAHVVQEITALRMAPGGVERYLAQLAASKDDAEAEHGRQVAALRQERDRLAQRLQRAKAAHLDAPETYTLADVRGVQAAVADAIAELDRQLRAPAESSTSIDVDSVRRFLEDGTWLGLRDTEPAAFRAFLQLLLPRVEVHGRGDYRAVWAPALSAVRVT